MELKTENNGQTIKVEVIGRLDTISAPELLDAFERLGKDFNNLILDLKQLDYISSAGLRSLLQIHKSLEARGAKLDIVNVLDNVSSIFSLTGFDEILNIK